MGFEATLRLFIQSHMSCNCFALANNGGTQASDLDFLKPGAFWGVRGSTFNHRNTLGPSTIHHAKYRKVEKFFSQVKDSFQRHPEINKCGCLVLSGEMLNDSKPALIAGRVELKEMK